MVINGSASLFADWTVILNANNCTSLGYDVYLDNPCDHWGRKHVYGEILLPIITNFIFLYIIVYSLFNYQNKKLWFVLLFFIFSVPVLLAIERNNIDLIIFIFMFFIAKYNNIFFNYFLILFSSIVKFYPILLSAIFFFEIKLKNILINLIILLLFFLIFSIFQIESLFKIFNNQEQFSGYGYDLYEFSFLGSIKFLNFLNVDFNGVDFNWVKYLYIVFFIALPIILFNFIYSNQIKLLFYDFNFDKKNNFENNLYFLSSLVILFCYFSFSNFVYREIFFLGLLPLILTYLKESNKILLFYFFLLVIKFFFTTLLIYFFYNNILSPLKPLMIVLKHTLDFYLISLVLHIHYNLTVSFFQKKIVS